MSDIKSAGLFACTDRLNTVIKECWSDAYFNIGIIHFNTREIRLLEKVFWRLRSMVTIYRVGMGRRNKEKQQHPNLI